MDGTLVDTEPYWMESEIALVESFGGTWTHEDGLQLVGNGLEESARILQSAGVALPIQEIVDTLTDAVRVRVRERVPFRPGAAELVQAVREAGIPVALVTMSLRRMALDAVGSLGFDVVIAGDDATRPKPFPDPYEQAARALGVDIRQCVAVEDSPTGIRSARAAGARVIGVEHIIPIAHAEPHEHWFTLEGRTPADFSLPMIPEDAS